MASTPADLAAILGLLNELIGLVRNIQPSSTVPAVELRPYAIQTDTDLLMLRTADVYSGLPAIRDAIGLLKADLDSDVTTILAAILTRQSGASPVILPSTAPTGYGGSLTASQVWNYPLGPSGEFAGDWLTAAGFDAQVETREGVAKGLGAHPEWTVIQTWDDPFSTDEYQDAIPVPDKATILPTDTSLQFWLNRVYGFTSDAFTADGYYTFALAGQSNQYIWQFGPTQFKEYQWLQTIRQLTTPQAPIYPGFDGITLGSIVAVADGLKVDGPMHGCLVLLNTVPDRLQRFQYGDAYSAWKNVGSLTFATDGEDQEEFQQLVFNDGIYLPKSMVIAQNVKFKTVAGLDATMVPFVINPPV